MNKISDVARETVRRRNNKWAAVAWKGGKCKACNKIVTSETIEDFQFDHRQEIRAGHNNSDRWGGAIRQWAPFTEKWIAWMTHMDLLCHGCHIEKHRPALLLFDDVQIRLDEHNPGPPFAEQLDFLMNGGSE